MVGKQFENDEGLFEGRNIKDETREKSADNNPFLPITSGYNPGLA